MAAKAQTVREYLARLSSGQRNALQKLRRAIKAAAPKAEECISYGVPAFRLNGKVLVWFAAHSNHVSFYPGAQPIRVHKALLKKYKTAKGTIRFTSDDPLPATLVRKLVRARIAQLAH